MLTESNYVSNWEYCKSRSAYHFDPKRQDHMGDWFGVIGTFTNTWCEELKTINNTRPMTWANRKNTNGRSDVVPPQLELEEYDIIQGGGNPNMVLVETLDDFSNCPNIQALGDFFGLEPGYHSRLHVQHTGQMFNNHMDKMDAVFPNNTDDEIVKFIIMLSDWCPGHFYQYGNYTYEHWRAGECHWFDWYNIPHGTANTSYEPRYSLGITGIKTSRTVDILNGLIELS